MNIVYCFYEKFWLSKMLLHFNELLSTLGDTIFFFYYLFISFTILFLKIWTLSRVWSWLYFDQGSTVNTIIGVPNDGVFPPKRIKNKNKDKTHFIIALESRYRYHIVLNCILLSCIYTKKWDRFNSISIFEVWCMRHLTVRVIDGVEWAWQIFVVVLKV